MLWSGLHSRQPSIVDDGFHAIDFVARRDYTSIILVAGPDSRLDSLRLIRVRRTQQRLSTGAAHRVGARYVGTGGHHRVAPLSAAGNRSCAKTCPGFGEGARRGFGRVALRKCSGVATQASSALSAVVVMGSPGGRQWPEKRFGSGLRGPIQCNGLQHRGISVRFAKPL
jgi:hypothetical protein